MDKKKKVKHHVCDDTYEPPYLKKWRERVFGKTIKKKKPEDDDAAEAAEEEEDEGEEEKGET